MVSVRDGTGRRSTGDRPVGLPVGSGRVEKARPAGQTCFEDLENFKSNHVYFIDYFNYILILYSAFVKILAWHKICSIPP